MSHYLNRTLFRKMKFIVPIFCFKRAFKILLSVNGSTRCISYAEVRTVLQSKIFAWCIHSVSEAAKIIYRHPQE